MISLLQDCFVQPEVVLVQEEQPEACKSKLLFSPNKYSECFVEEGFVVHIVQHSALSYTT